MKILKPIFGIALVYTMLLVTSCFFNCEEGNRTLTHKSVKSSTIQSVKVSCDANVVLVADSSFSRDSIRVEAESNIIDLIRIDVRGESLRIESDRCYSSHIQPVIYIPVKNIEVLKVNGSGNITGRGKVKGSDVSLQVNGSGSIDLILETANLSSQINGSGDINLKGAAQKHKISVNGSGNLNTFDFVTGRTSITVNGSGDCRVTATTDLEVKVRGSGNVFYKGTPNINTNIAGSGSVSKQD